ncbi:MAG: response regulator [Dehalococcoidales bacterium]|nr:response regulator [Dehalococcoidales bacterium]
MKKILIIDNEPSLRKIIQTNLNASGYSASVAQDGEEGLKLAKSLQPDLILLDIKMPGMSGWDVLTTLHASPKLEHIPVIIMTAFLRDTEETRARKMVAGFMEKPFSVADLLGTVKKALGE